MISYASLCVYWKWPPQLHKLQLVLVLASCFLVHLSLGTIYTFGNMVPYMVSYVRNSSHPSDLRMTDATYINACQLAGQGLSMVFGGILERRLGPRLVTLLGGLLMSSGVALSYFAIQYSFWIMIATYGLMFGIGIGLAYVGPISCAMKWLPKWKGLASGIVVSGFGLSALLFNAVQTGYINPHNIPPDYSPYPEKPDEKYFTDKELLNRVPRVFLILALCYTGMQLIGSIFIVNPPPPDETGYTAIPDSDLNYVRNRDRRDSESSINLCAKDYITNCQSDSKEENGIEDSTKIDKRNKKNQIDDDSDDESTSISRTVSSNSVSSELERSVSSWSSNVIYNLTPLQMITKPNFYLLWIMFLCVGTATALVSSLYKSFGLEKVTRDDQFLTIAGSVSAFFNLLGRILWGVLADLTTYKLAFVLQGAMMSSLLVTFYATSEVGKVMFFFWICGIFFCIGGYFSLFPTATARGFGQHNVSVNYGLLFTSQIVGGALAGFISQKLVLLIDWYGVFFLVGGLSCVEFIIALVYRHKRYIRLRRPDDLHTSATRSEESAIKFPYD